ncbi:uncharacterized protein [Setaria viridis]|uniref:uncharacterized protein n=1 Tax=Setaria viridis TaxID=4556 RepID=UPI003B3BC170
MVPGPFRQLCRDTEGSSLHCPDIDFFGTVFAEVPPPAMAAPPANIVDDQPAPTPQVPQKRHSKRLLARPPSVPVSRRSTHRLMRQLDIVGQDQAIGDEAVAQYEKMYKGPMPRKTVAALAAISRVASGVLMAALAAINCCGSCGCRLLVIMNSNFAIFNWNVRGLNSAARREEVLKLLQASRPMLVCLQESKLEEITDSLAVEFLGQRLSSFSYLPALGVSGGIILAWDDDHIQAGSVSLKEFSLTATVTQRLTNVSFIITVVYGPATDADKPRFLEELKGIKPVDNQLWLCLGDFNLIYSAQDKNNLNLNRRFMGMFRRTLDQCELLEICSAKS